MTARAELVIDEPAMYYACPKGKSWEDVRRCLAGQGRPAVVKQIEIEGAKLVRLDQLENGQWVDGGVYLYAERKGEWAIAGSFFGRGTAYEMLQLERMTIGKQVGVRVEIAQASPMFVQLDGLTIRRAVRRAYQTMFCSARGDACTQVTRSCEVLVRGAAYWMFRGELKLEGQEVVVSGDRRLAGPFCVQAERVYLGWPPG